MPTPANRAGARGLVLVLLVLIVAMVAVDLFSADSMIRSAWGDFFGPRSMLRRVLDGLRSRGLRWNR